jgi:hypothetical protein
MRGHYWTPPTSRVPRPGPAQHHPATTSARLIARVVSRRKARGWRVAGMRPGGYAQTTLPGAPGRISLPRPGFAAGPAAHHRRGRGCREPGIPGQSGCRLLAHSRALPHDSLGPDGSRRLRDSWEHPRGHRALRREGERARQQLSPCALDGAADGLPGRGGPAPVRSRRSRARSSPSARGGPGSRLSSISHARPKLALAG